MFEQEIQQALSADLEGSPTYRALKALDYYGCDVCLRTSADGWLCYIERNGVRAWAMNDDPVLAVDEAFREFCNKLNAALEDE